MMKELISYGMAAVMTLGGTLEAKEVYTPKVYLKCGSEEALQMLHEKPEEFLRHFYQKTEK